VHWYERFALQNPSAQADPNGIREFIVGTGGESYMVPSSPAANSQALHYGTYGVLELTLHSGSYDWSFVPDTGSAAGCFTDSGSDACHRAAVAPDLTPPDDDDAVVHDQPLSDHLEQVLGDRLTVRGRQCRWRGGGQDLLHHRRLHADRDQPDVRLAVVDSQRRPRCGSSPPTSRATSSR
jgi:hypothetical protein